MIDPGFDPEFATAAEWARLYRDNGVQIVPCRNKIPRLKSWKEYQHALVPDAQFEAWYGHDGEFHDSYDMGMLTGTASGNILMIDLDIYKDGGENAARWWQSILAVHNNGMSLDTWRQATGGGGRQMFFLYPPRWKYAVNAKTDLNVDIRCQGGFAVLPPTRHASGNAYTWMDGCAPWELPIALAPDWLLTEVERLIREHGGGTVGNGQADRTNQGANTATAANTAAASFDAFGHQTDGRETKMRDIVWAAVIDWYRECPIKPSERESATKASEKYLIYEDQVSPRTVDPAFSKTALLELEGRGFSAFGDKWHRAMEQWDTKVAEEARRPGKSDNYRAEQTPLLPAGQPLILTDVQFLGDFKPPDYLVDGMIQKGYLYSLTGPTGHGKTPVSMLMGCKVARGLDYHGKPVTQGGVLFLAGENADDIRARYIAMADHEGFAVGSIPFYFIDGVVDIAACMSRIEAEAALIPNLSLVIIDTDQAYFLGDEGNSNEQRKAFAQLLRRLLKLPGNPAALVNCHPTKNATQDNLVPMGGSSFLNEVDGNITCWTDDRTCTIRPHGSKWRGVAFESMAFELKTITADALKDTKGRHISSVIAVPITEAGAERRAAVAEADEDTVLRLIEASKNISLTMIAKRAGFLWPDGSPAKSKAQRVIERLKRSKMIYNYRGSTYKLTKKGCKAIGVKWRSGEDENDDD